MITMRSSRAWSWTSIASLAGVSVALLVASLAAPEWLGIMLVAPGLVGLFGLRLIALHRGWPPRLNSGLVT